MAPSYLFLLTCASTLMSIFSFLILLPFLFPFRTLFVCRLWPPTFHIRAKKKKEQRWAIWGGGEKKRRIKCLLCKRQRRCSKATGSKGRRKGNFITGTAFMWCMRHLHCAWETYDTSHSNKQSCHFSNLDYCLCFPTPLHSRWLDYLLKVCCLQVKQKTQAWEQQNPIVKLLGQDTEPQYASSLYNKWKNKCMCVSEWC